MQKISSRSIAVAEKIRDREPFVTYGALKAVAPANGLSVWDSGQLSGGDFDVFRGVMQNIAYVVYSYSTPIAWWSEYHGWHRVSQKFSMTTSHHQGRLYLIGTEVCDGLPLDQTKCSDRAAHM